MAVSALSPKAPAKPVSRFKKVCLMQCLQRNQPLTPLRRRSFRQLRLRQPLRLTALVRKASDLLVAEAQAVVVAVRVKVEAVEVREAAVAVRVKVAAAVPMSRPKRITKKRILRSLA